MVSLETTTIMLYNNVHIVDSNKQNGSSRPKAPVSLSASYTSTVAEELINLIRKLHTVNDWTPYINHYICENLAHTGGLIVDKLQTLSVSKTMYTT
jgi:E3 ubiquitin-protein ligase HERC2